MAGLNGDSQISGIVGGMPLVITTYDRLAGAIGSLTWNGVEFIDTGGWDHGRELQGSVGFPTGRVPTEAGASADGSGPSTSVLQSINAHDNYLTTQTQMANWTPQTLSDCVLIKNVTIGHISTGYAIEYHQYFQVPEYHTGSSISLWGYMPIGFSQYWAFNPYTNVLQDLTGYPMGSGDDCFAQATWPLIFSLASDHNYSMGIYSPDLTDMYGNTVLNRGWIHSAYGTGYWGGGAPCTIWEAHKEYNSPQSTYTFMCYVIVGTLQDVKSAMISLHQYLHLPTSFSLPQSSPPLNGATNVALSGTLKWDASTNATSYDVYLDINDPPTTLVANQVGTTYSYSNLTGSSVYYWRIVARNSFGTRNCTPSRYSFTTTAVVVYDYTIVGVAGIHALTSSIPTFTLHKTLTLYNAVNALSSDNVKLSVIETLAEIGNVEHGVSSDSLTLAWSYFILIESYAYTADGVIIANGSIKAGGNSFPHLLTSDILDLVQEHTIRGDRAYTADGAFLASGLILAGTNFEDFIALTNAFQWPYIIRGLDAFPADGSFYADGSVTAGTNFGSRHSISSDSFALDLIRCDAADTVHSLLASSITLTELFILSVNSCSHNVLSDGIVLTQEHYTILENILHTLISDECTAVATSTVSVENSVHTFVSGNPVLVYHYLLVIQNPRHKIISTNFDHLRWFGDWRDYKDHGGPWTFNKQQAKWGYLNNPRWTNKT